MKSNVQVEGLAAFLIADDLTGACDSAAPFAVRGLHTHVALARGHMPRAEVLAFNTDSRDVAVETARIRIRAAIELAHRCKPHLLFKKIDSVFRGNSFDEISACLDFLPDKFAILAPAFPPLGRRVRGGQLIVDDLAGHFVLDIPSQLRQRNIKFRTLTGGDSPMKEITRAKKDGLRLILCDTETEQDLDTIVNAGFCSRLDLVWLGSSGLARALANVQAISNRETALPPPSTGAILFCIGSDHPISIEQIRYLKRTRTVAEVFLGAETRGEIRLALKSNTNVLLHIDDTRSNLGQSYLWKIRDMFRPHAEHRIAALVLSGGDTAATVCDALEVQTIELRNELLPGIPCGVIRGGIADGLTVVTKSGGFGAEDALQCVAHLCEGKKKAQS